MRIFVTRQIPDRGIKMLKEKGYEVEINLEDRVFKKEELIAALEKGKYDAVLCNLDDRITDEILDVGKANGVRIFANYAVGYDNIDVKAAGEWGILITNTPGVLTNTVAEHTFGLLLAIARRIPEADRYTRSGQFKS